MNDSQSRTVRPLTGGVSESLIAGWLESVLGDESSAHILLGAALAEAGVLAVPRDPVSALVFVRAFVAPRLCHAIGTWPAAHVLDAFEQRIAAISGSDTPP